MARLLLIAAITLGLAPGTLVRTHYDHDPAAIEITLTSLGEGLEDTRGGVRGQLALTGVWQLTASSPFFGGFSALVNASENAAQGALLAGSDKGWSLAIPLNSDEPAGDGFEFRYFAARSGAYSSMFDLEAMARDPETGTLWTAYEGYNAVQRSGADGAIARSAPEQMRRWSANSGPETMVRMADGRFIILAESPEGSGHEYDGRPTRPGLLFESDPVGADPVEAGGHEEPKATAFRLTTPAKFSPVDATALPDGSVLILLRRLQITIPATFDAAIMHADPADIEEGGVWSGEIIARLDGPLFGENFEGIAYVPGTEEATAENTGAIYLISDDNLSVFQRSLLVRLNWPPTEQSK